MSPVGGVGINYAIQDAIETANQLAGKLKAGTVTDADPAGDNAALVNLARSRVGVTRYQEVAVLDRIRAEVAEAYARTHARFAQIGTTEQAVSTGTDGYRADLIRLENTVGLPIELLDSMRLLARARYEYLNAIIDYNAAQFSLYPLGQSHMDEIYGCIDFLKRSGVFDRSKHFCTKLGGDAGAVFATLGEAFLRFGAPEGHVTLDLKVSANSPTLAGPA